MDRYFTISLFNPTNGLGLVYPPPTATVTITDPNPKPTVQFTTSNQTVGASDTTLTAYISVNGTVSSPIIVNCTADPGTATQPTDYEINPNPTQLTFSSATSQPITLTIHHVAGDARTFRLRISSISTNAVPFDPTTDNITIEEPSLTLPVVHLLSFDNPYDLVTPNSSYTVWVELESTPSGTVQVNFDTHQGTATEGVDYQGVHQTLTLSASNLLQSISIPIYSDPFLQGNVQFTVALSSPVNATIEPPSSLPVTIVYAPGPTAAQFAKVNYSTSDQVQYVTLSVVLNQPPESTNMQVPYSTSDLTAKAGSTQDYQAVNNGIVNFTSGGALSQDIQIPIFDDHMVEQDETFSVTLGTPSSGVLGLLSKAEVTIHDADTGAPHVTFNNVPVLENAGTAQLRASLSRPYSIPFTVNYHTNNGGATAPGDYTAISAGTLTIPANQPTAPVGVTIINDNDPYEPSKSFTVSVSGGTNTNYIYNVYSDLLLRDADQQGLNGWNGALSGGTTRAQVARNFQSSAEYLPEVVDRGYQRYLFRRGDAGGMSNWTSQVLNVSGFTLEDLIGNLTGSDEYFSFRANQDKSIFVQDLYNDILGRPADQAGYNSWLSQLNNGTKTRVQVATAIAKSAEYYTNYVGDMYKRYLRRTGSNGEISNWSNQLTNQQIRSEDFVAGVLGSTEYWNNLGIIAATGTGTVTINDPPDPGPQVTSPGDQYNFELDSVSLPIVASDPDGDTVHYSATGLQPLGLTIDGTSGVISGTIPTTAATGDYGLYPVTVTVTDGQTNANGPVQTQVQFYWTVWDSSDWQPAGFPAPTPPDDCGCIKDSVSTASGISGEGSPDSPDDNPVRSFDGALNITSSDLQSSGLGITWGQDRNLTSGQGYAATAFNGAGSVVAELPYLRQDTTIGNHIAVISNGINARYFDQANGAYHSRFYLQETLTHPASGLFVLTTTDGTVLKFSDFASALPANQQGQFQSLTDRSGNVISVTSRTSDDGKPAEVQRSTAAGVVTESYVYTYLAGHIASVTLRRPAPGGGWTIVRMVAYTYYDGSPGTHGAAGDLMLAQIEDGSGNVLDSDYYRYFTGESGGPVGGLKYEFDADSYARLQAAYPAPASAIDDQVAPFATHAFQYDSQGRVLSDTAQGGGGSGAPVGLGTSSYVYFQSSNPNGYNSWKYRTIETLNDGSQNTIYSNYAGEIMLTSFHDAATGNNFNTFYKYDSAGRLLMTAGPSAVFSYDGTKADLLNKVNGNYQFLSDHSGLIETTDYYSMTTATVTTAGGVAGYEQDTKIQQGELGTPIFQSSQQYFAFTAGGQTVYPIASSTVYRNSDKTGAETTTYGYMIDDNHPSP